MNRLIALTFATVLLSSPALAGPQSHCEPNEKTWLNAAVGKSGKIVSICGSDAAEAGWLQYRFGRPGDAELVYPENKNGSLAAFTLRRYTRPQTTYLKLEFTNNGYTYAILEGFDGSASPRESADLRVKRNSDGKEIVNTPIRLTTQPMGVMQLEGRVVSKPFDE